METIGREPRPRTGPLTGMRVADFCWMGVGACATRMLADYGAEVIKIENRKRIDLPRRLPIYKGEVRSYGAELKNPDVNKGGLFNNYNRNKLGITVDMGTPKGRELVDRLIAASDAVTENFAPGVMERWGLTYDRLNEISPEVIFGRMSGFGHSGPRENYRSYGPVVQAVSGLTQISGLPGREPSGWGLSYMDNQAALYNTAGILMAWFDKQRTGKGTEIDVSAVEVGVTLAGPDLLDATVNGRSTRREGYPRGNRLEHPDAAPHGVYPCRDTDTWVAISVFTDEEWARMVDVMGNPAWAGTDFATSAQRAADQDRLDKLVGEWTSTQTPHYVMERLQGVDVIAGAAQNSRDLCEVDPQLAQRGVFFELDHPVIGEALFEGNPMNFSSPMEDIWRSAPLLGEDNHYVWGQIVGLGADEIAELEEEGII